VNDEQEAKCKEAFRAYFKVLSRNLLAVLKQIMKPRSVFPVSWTRDLPNTEQDW